jgi:hypothetical protein
MQLPRPCGLFNPNFWRGVILAGVAYSVYLLSLLVSWQPVNTPNVVRNFVRNQRHYDRYAEQIRSGLVAKDSNGQFPVPAELRRQRVWEIRAEGSFIFFLHLPHWPDDADRSMVYALDPKTSAVSCLLALPKSRTTYHVQYVTGHWFYWMYD